MTLDMRPMLRGEVSQIPIDFALTPDPIVGITYTADARVTGEITDEAGYMRLTLQIALPFEGECARCLCAVRDTFLLEFERTVADEGTLTEEQMEDNVDEYVIIRDGELDLDEELREALVLSFPFRVLCEEDCPGLCPKCGKSLADGDCGCKKEKEIDPRMKIFEKLLNDGE